MKSAASALLVAGLALVTYRLASNPTVCTMVYIAISYVLNLDSDVPRVHNYAGQIEDGVFKHRFIPLDKTFSGKRVNVTYHVVECGDQSAEPIVFFHGLAESWRVWKDHMALFCSTHYVVGVDSEGMGQSEWDNVLRDLPKYDARAFMADMTRALLKNLNIEKFNLVVTDYSFWSTLKLLDTSVYGDIILRYGKFQSTVGVEDVARVPQAMLFTYAPGFMEMLFSSNPYALPRILFGRTLAQWVPGLRENGRAYQVPDEKTFREVILEHVNPTLYTPWVYFYHYGFNMIQQMELQMKLFEDFKHPVIIVQGAADKGQPINLFDGTGKMHLEYSPAKTIGEKIRRPGNHTHRLVTQYSTDGEVIGPKADEFFPKSSWKKLVILKNAGHFVHIEAVKETSEALRELLAVPLQK